jgi:type II secretory pathway pseudopilin PulG
MSTTATTKETVMGQVIPSQHPAVVLKSHYKAVRALLAAALIAIVALAATVVILADDSDTKASSAPISHQAQAAQQQAPGVRFDGGPDEGTRGLAAQPSAPVARFDGGPEEGTRGPRSYYEQPGQRSSYQPAPADGFKDHAGGPRMMPQGPASR